MELSHVVPWGRSFREYREMFCLTDSDLKKSILGCGDGPASFNSELTSMGGSVISADPVYAFSAIQLQARIAEVYAEIIPKMEATQSQYIWESIPSVDALGQVRMDAMLRFLTDYEQGRQQGRYVECSLPELPFNNKQFDLALCSHYLFLYRSQVSLVQHLDSVFELLRVAREVRIYPLVTLDGSPSPYLQKVMTALKQQGADVQLLSSAYVFQKGATHTLAIREQ